MISIESLKAAGCDVELGIKRCGDDTDFYLELVESALEEDRYKKLESQITGSDWKGAFESAHALKGVASNLSLSPLTHISVALTELLRPKAPCECQELLNKLLNARKSLLRQ